MITKRKILYDMYHPDYTWSEKDKCWINDDDIQDFWKQPDYGPLSSHRSFSSKKMAIRGLINSPKGTVLVRWKRKKLNGELKNYKWDVWDKIKERRC